MDNYKQVIVMRTDLNMRKGKMIAQGAHASIMCMTEERAFAPDSDVTCWFIFSAMTKICVRCNSEEELLEIDRLAKAAGLRCYVVTDAGHTEFDGPTRTCLAIGPNKSEDIDKITGGLKLL